MFQIIGISNRQMLRGSTMSKVIILLGPILLQGFYSYTITGLQRWIILTRSVSLRVIYIFIGLLCLQAYSTGLFLRVVYLYIIAYVFVGLLQLYLTELQRWIILIYRGLSDVLRAFGAKQVVLDIYNTLRFQAYNLLKVQGQNTQYYLS